MPNLVGYRKGSSSYFFVFKQQSEFFKLIFWLFLLEGILMGWHSNGATYATYSPKVNFWNRSHDETKVNGYVKSLKIKGASLSFIGQLSDLSGLKEEQTFFLKELLDIPLRFRTTFILMCMKKGHLKCVIFQWIDGRTNFFFEETTGDTS